MRNDITVVAEAVVGFAEYGALKESPVVQVKAHPANMYHHLAFPRAAKAGFLKSRFKSAKLQKQAALDAYLPPLRAFSRDLGLVQQDLKNVRGAGQEILEAAAEVLRASSSPDASRNALKSLQERQRLALDRVQALDAALPMVVDNTNTYCELARKQAMDLEKYLKNGLVYDMLPQLDEGIEGLAAILGTDAEIGVVGLAGNGEEALALVAQLHPDLVLMDLKMPVLNGVQATRLLHDRYPGVRVLILTTYADDQWVFDALRAGAAGYLLKDTRRADLVAAVRGTAGGKTYLDPAVAGKLIQQVRATAPSAAPTGGAHAAGAADALKERELEVLRLIALGYNNQDIAQRLHLATGTVRNYVSAILQKLGVEDRTQAAVVAYQRGWVERG